MIAQRQRILDTGRNVAGPQVFISDERTSARWWNQFSLGWVLYVPRHSRKNMSKFPWLSSRHRKAYSVSNYKTNTSFLVAKCPPNWHRLLKIGLLKFMNSFMCHRNIGEHNTRIESLIDCSEGFNFGTVKKSFIPSMQCMHRALSSIDFRWNTNQSCPHVFVLRNLLISPHLPQNILLTIVIGINLVRNKLVSWAMFH